MITVNEHIMNTCLNLWSYL